MTTSKNQKKKSRILLLECLLMDFLEELHDGSAFSILLSGIIIG